jgi:TonB family protein
MAFKSLLLSKDADLVQILSRLLKDLDIAVEPCSEPFAAAKRLMDQQFDAILVDCEDEQGAGWVLQSARMATASKKSVTIAIVGAQSSGQGGPRAGENFVIQKPIVLKQVESTLRAARGLMGDAGTGPRSEAPAPVSSVLTEKPLNPVPAPHPVTSGQGRPPAELFDELTAALDRLGPQGSPAKPAPVALASSGAAAAAAPAWEKPVPVASPSSGAAAAAAPAWEKASPAVPEPTLPPPEPAAPPVLRPAQQAWPGLITPPSAPAKSEAPAVLPLAATAAEMKPAVRPAQDQVRSNNALDDVRRRMSAAAPPAWRTDVEERQEAAAPRFSSLAMDEEPRKGFPFKAIAVAMVLVSLALFGYSWYRGRNAANPPVNQEQAPATQPQPTAQGPNNAAPEAAAVSPGGDADNSAAAKIDSSATQAARTPSVASVRPSKAASETKPAADVTAPDTTTTDVGLPPAPLVVEGGRLHSSPSAHADEAQMKPPTLDAVANAGKPELGGVMSPAPVDVPKLAAAVPQRIKVSQGVTQGLLVRQVKPQYPAMARETRVEGDVVLAAVIGKDGTVRDLKVVSGPAILVSSAMQAVRQWRYKPYLLNGQPVEVETQIKLQFRL